MAASGHCPMRKSRPSRPRHQRVHVEWPGAERTPCAEHRRAGDNAMAAAATAIPTPFLNIRRHERPVQPSRPPSGPRPAAATRCAATSPCPRRWGADSVSVTKPAALMAATTGSCARRSMASERPGRSKLRRRTSAKRSSARRIWPSSVGLRNAKSSAGTVPIACTGAAHASPPQASARAGSLPCRPGRQGGNGSKPSSLTAGGHHVRLPVKSPREPRRTAPGVGRMSAS